MITYRTVPEVAYHVKPIHVNTTHYVINTRSHLGQLFALRLSYLTEGGEGTLSGVEIIRAGEKIYSRRTLKHVKTYIYLSCYDWSQGHNIDVFLLINNWINHNITGFTGRAPLPFLYVWRNGPRIRQKGTRVQRILRVVKMYNLFTLGYLYAMIYS